MAARRRRRHNWVAVRSAYVYGTKRAGRLRWPSYRDLARRYGIQLGSIADVAARDGWVAQRAAYQQELDEQLRRASIAAASQVATEVSQDVSELLRGVARRAAQLMTEPELGADDLFRLAKVAGMVDAQLRNMLGGG